MPTADSSTSTSTQTAVQNDVEQMPPFNVVLLNDDDHSYEYVIEMLGQLFRMPAERAMQVAKTVDAEGRADPDDDPQGAGRTQARPDSRLRAQSADHVVRRARCRRRSSRRSRATTTPTASARTVAIERAQALAVQAEELRRRGGGVPFAALPPREVPLQRGSCVSSALLHEARAAGGANLLPRG
jgi:hypothetical protein